MKKVEIYTWSSCPYCRRAMKLLDKTNVEFVEYEISHDNSKLGDLKKITGSGTVPQIFVDNQFIGGCDDIMALYKSGEYDSIFR